VTRPLRPSEELGRVAADSYRANRGRSLGRLASLITHFALRGVPEGEADLLSYLYFDRSFTRRLLEMGRADAEAARDRILALLADPAPGG
jgi:NTE family protein